MDAYKIFAFVASVILAIPSLHGEAQMLPMLQQASISVVRIEAHNCQASGVLSSDRTATGFVWRDQHTVVTALHVISGCSNVVATYHIPNTISRAASPAKVSLWSDLALLFIADPPASVPPLVADTQQPTMETKLQVLGFPLQIPSISSTTLSIRFGASKLRDIIPSSVSNELSRVNSPSLDLIVTNVEGHLLPGLSGAPVLSPLGKIVAIGDGGLENGTVGISWCIPVETLTRLPASTDTVPTPTTRSRALFAAESEAGIFGRVTCSGTVLTKVRTVNFEQIGRFTDDVLGLQQLVNVFGAKPEVLSFDVYQDLIGGATVSVPKGVALTPDADGCTAELESGDFRLKVQVAKLASAVVAQAESVRAELRVVGGSPEGWIADPAYTYFQPVPRFDGLIVRRRAYSHLNPALIAPNSSPQDGYIFETLAQRGTSMITVSAEAINFTFARNQRMMGCRLMPSADGCHDVNAETDEWAKAVIAVHLATFPIG